MDPTRTQEITQQVRKSSGMLILLGMITVVLGMLAIGAPLMTGISIALLAGALLVISGVAETVYAFRASTWGLGILTFVMGALTVVAGMLVIAHPLAGLGFLTLLLIAYFVVEGLVQIVHALGLRPIAGWGWTLFSGIVSLMLGIMLWRQWPLSGAWAVGVLIGLRILFTGWSMVALGMAGRTATRETAAG